MKKIILSLLLLFVFVNSKAQITIDGLITDGITQKENLCSSLPLTLSGDADRTDVNIMYSLERGEICDLFWLSFGPEGEKHKRMMQLLLNNMKKGLFDGRVVEGMGNCDIVFNLEDNSTAKLSLCYTMYEGDNSMPQFVQSYASLLTKDNFNEFSKLLKKDIKSFTLKINGKTISPVIKFRPKNKNTLAIMAKALNIPRLLELSVLGKTTSKTTFSNTKKTFTVKGVSFTMIPVQGTRFTMGKNAELGNNPAHMVTVSNYMIGETEVTQALWKAVMGTNPTDRYNKIGNNYPVTDVSWDDCQIFIKKLNALTGQNFRLPTEAEWEYAAQGGLKTKGYNYSGSNTASKVAWFVENSDGHLHAVKTKLPNELGIYDMSGNVQEWCKDFYSRYPTQHQVNPQGPSSGESHICRGGAYMSGITGQILLYRRGSTPYGGKSSDLGLRLAL